MKCQTEGPQKDIPEHKSPQSRYNSIQFIIYLFTFLLNSPMANYKRSRRKDKEKKQIHKGNKRQNNAT
jgi:hypothetical protein